MNSQKAYYDYAQKIDRALAAETKKAKRKAWRRVCEAKKRLKTISDRQQGKTHYEPGM